MEIIFKLITTMTYIVTGASIIAAMTPSKKDDEWIGKILGYIDMIALNVKGKK